MKTTSNDLEARAQAYGPYGRSAGALGASRSTGNNGSINDYGAGTAGGAWSLRMTGGAARAARGRSRRQNLEILQGGRRGAESACGTRCASSLSRLSDSGAHAQLLSLGGQELVADLIGNWQLARGLEKRWRRVSSPEGSWAQLAAPGKRRRGRLPPSPHDRCRQQTPGNRNGTAPRSLRSA